MLTELFEKSQKISFEEMEETILKAYKLLESERILKEINGLTVNEDLILCSPANIEYCTYIR